MPILAAILSCSARGQVYKLGPGSSSTTPGSPTVQQQTPSQELGFGSNIQNARLARAAELALRRGDYAEALADAQRAARAAPSDAHLWFLVGYAARLNGKLQISADAYMRGLRQVPSSGEGLSGLAQTYSLMGRTADAQKLLKQAIAANPGNRDNLQLLGDLYMRSGDYPEAIQWLLRAERIRPDARSELLLALSYQHQNQMDLSRHYLEMATRRAPNNPDVLRTLANYYRQVGDYPKAIASLESIQHPPADVTAELAYTYQLDGQQKKSAELYAHAAQAKPRDIGLQLSAAQAFVAADSIGEAKPFLDRAEALDSHSYRLHAIRGEIAQREQRNRDAVREYSAALSLLPSAPIEGPLYRIQLHIDLMHLYRKLDDETSAAQELAVARKEIDAIDLQGTSRAPFLRLRATIKMNSGDLDGGFKDIQEALAIAPRDPNNLQLDGDLLMKMGRVQDAIAAYRKVLDVDPKNQFALTSVGYALREAGKVDEARKVFERLAHDYPSLYVPYLALGDLETAHRDFDRAQASYRKAYSLDPKNSLIVAGGMNAAIEAHKLDIAAEWLKRASEEMRRQPQMLKQRERYLRLHGDFRESAEVGRKAIEVLPRDRDVIVYLGYDLLELGKYKELLELTQKYNSVLPQEPDLPLLAGYVHTHDRQLQEALADFTETLKRDPNVVTAYVNRGYVLNDLRQPEAASADFLAALKRDPENGQAHLGLAYSYLSLDRSRDALRQSVLAEKTMGDSEKIHVIRATAYGREGMLTKAVEEYRAALKFAPNDGTLYMGLGNALFSQRRYQEAVDQLQTARKYSPDNAGIDALLARAYAQMDDREPAMQYVSLAEQKAERTSAKSKSTSGGQAEISQVYVSTGQALTTLGEQKAAMDRFRKALTMPGSNRVGVRLAIARLMADQDRPSVAERQIALAMMEAEGGATAPPTGSQYIEAADVFRQMHEYSLSETYLKRARAAGAPEMSVRVGMANTYLALGDTARAAGELAAIGNSPETASDYQYLLAQANLYQQQHHGAEALTAFAQASNAAGANQGVEQSLLQAAANEGYRINPTLSLLGNFLVQPIFEDTTVYVLDSKLDTPVPIPPTDIDHLPPPRSSLGTQGTVAYHLHLDHLPTVSGFFQMNNTRGTISVPAFIGVPGLHSIVKRNTTDYSMNIGLAPTVHLGRNALTFDSGIQGTVRRDSLSPVQMNQNLFRVFTYMSTSSFFDLVAVSGYGIYEAGPFTESNLHSRMTTGAVDFRVGSPWGRTALVTGWGASDQQFSPAHVEDYYTSSYIGLTHRFGQRFNVEALVEDLRSWRIVETRFGIAQALRPAATIDFAPARHWNIHASTAYSSTRSFHVYDATQNAFSVSYERPLERTLNDKTGDIRVGYPIRFSAGIQQETFFNFTHGKNQTFRPYVSITIF